MKFSEDSIKALLPGIKSVLRVYTNGNKPSFDLICMRSEVKSLCKQKSIKYYNKKALGQNSFQVDVEKVTLQTQKIWAKGQDCTATSKQTNSERRAATIQALEEYGAVKFLIDSKEKYPVYFSEGVYGLFCKKYSENLEIRNTSDQNGGLLGKRTHSKRKQ